MEQATGKFQSLTWRKNTYSLLIVISTFFMWGLLTILVDSLRQPLLNTVKDLNDPETAREVYQLYSSISLFIFFGTYFFFSYPAGRIVRRTGYKNGMTLGLALSAIGCVGIIPGSLMGSFVLILIALVLLATGITFLQVAANPYVVFTVKPELSASRLTFLQAFNSIGTLVGVALSGIIMMKSPFAELTEYCVGNGKFNIEMNRQFNAISLITPFIIIGALFMIGAIIVVLSKLPEATATHLEGEIDEKKKRSAIQYPHLWFGAIAIFAYVGAEVAIGMNLDKYYMEVNLVTGKSISFDPKYLIYFYLGGALLGRLVGSVILVKSEPQNVLVMSAIACSALVFVAIANHDLYAVFMLTAVGMFNSVLFPIIFSLGIRGLGKHSEEGSSILIMGICGGGIIPFLFNMYHDNYASHHSLGDDFYHHTNYDNALWVPFMCYLIIVFYGLFGYRFRRKDSIHFDESSS